MIRQFQFSLRENFKELLKQINNRKIPENECVTCLLVGLMNDQLKFHFFLMVILIK